MVPHANWVSGVRPAGLTEAAASVRDQVLRKGLFVAFMMCIFGVPPVV
jgi:hypothetical protein